MTNYTLKNEISVELLLIVEPWAREYTVLPGQEVTLSFDDSRTWMESAVSQERGAPLTITLWLNKCNSFALEITDKWMKAPHA